LTHNPDPHVDTTCMPQCMPYPNPCIFNRYDSLLIHRDKLNTTIEYSKPQLMKSGNVDTQRACTDNNYNAFNNSDITFTIQNGRIYTNFASGAVYMNYHAFPLDDETGLPLIPDIPKIEMAIEAFIKYNIV